MPGLGGLARPVWSRRGPQQSAKRGLFTIRKRRTRFVGCTLAGLAFGGTALWYASDSRAGVHRWLVVPAIHALTAEDPEKAHRWSIAMLAHGFAPKDLGTDDPRLALKLWGKHIKNPIGLAAGYDKHAEAIDPLLNLGFGYVEVGSVTPEPQEGNPKPRVFRVPQSEAVVNRYGFNSDGHATVLSRLRERIHSFVYSHAHLLPSSVFPPPSPTQPFDPDPVTSLLLSEKGANSQLIDAMGIPRSMQPGQLLAINLGKNKTSAPEAVDDFVNGVTRLGPFADVIVVNVSSPNTPGLRSLQRAGIFEELLQSVKDARDALPQNVKPNILVKVAPDLSHDELEDVAFAARETHIDGIIVSNTTISRPPSAGDHPHLSQTGGLSGKPLKELSLSALKALYTATDGTIPLVGCGGISSAQDAVDFARAGASLVQLYTALTYQGVGLPRKIKDDLAEILGKEGKSWSDLVGSGVRLPSPQDIERQRAERQRMLAQAQSAAVLKTLTAEVERVLQTQPVPIEQEPPKIIVQKPVSAEASETNNGTESNADKAVDNPVPFSSLGKIFSTIGERGNASNQGPGKRLV